ncbi:Nif3-like dinuclear metal center hexameric protein [Vallitalea okinawensis]|uniref:Nif3-like dinuclear metal center hexameric protein n=1 Tax=Vallitalea okinawensis TaxID=2078660 RepID=UPI000CFB45A2|nr:Nif3-like dinuclear metal center hexameric protein [Vallitalea okinawensis]
MNVRVEDICKAMEQIAPTYMAEKWDNVGLLVGRKERKVQRILLALDATPDVINEAIDNKVDLIITHHPVPFKPVSRINSDHLVGRQLLDLMENKIALFTAHTNLDATTGGTADVVADLLGLTDQKLLTQLGVEKLLKLVVFVPEKDAEHVRQVIGDAGAGHIGNYSHCTFSTSGEGTFLPQDGSNPYIGQQGHLEKVNELRIETIVSSSQVSNVIKAMIDAHPYEEVAYDLYPLKLEDQPFGAGRVGYLKTTMSLESFAKEVKEKLQLESIQYVGDPNKIIKKVALCTGSAMDFIDDAIGSGADVYLTGDIKYHEASDAVSDGIALVNASHFGTECLILQMLEEKLNNIFANVDIIRTKVQKDPFITL